jgi:hypothetical protein
MWVPFFGLLLLSGSPGSRGVLDQKNIGENPIIPKGLELPRLAGQFIVFVGNPAMAQGEMRIMEACRHRQTTIPSPINS